MILNLVALQNFRNYSKREFKFNKNTTVIIGPNTSGKTNLIEAIFLLSSGESFRVERDGNPIINQENGKYRSTQKVKITVDFSS